MSWHVDKQSSPRKKMHSGVVSPDCNLEWRVSAAPDRTVLIALQVESASARLLVYLLGEPPERRHVDLLPALFHA